MTRKEFREERLDEIRRDKRTINEFQVKFKDRDAIIALQIIHELLDREKKSLINE